jgi:hypothetical protein
VFCEGVLFGHIYYGTLRSTEIIHPGDGRVLCVLTVLTVHVHGPRSTSPRFDSRFTVHYFCHTHVFSQSLFNALATRDCD